MLPSFADIIFAFLRNGVVYYILLSQLINGSIDVGMFVFYFGAATGFSLWLNSVSGQINNILTMSMNINFIRSFLETEDNFYRGETHNFSKDINTPTCDIELKNLTFNYPNDDNNILTNINVKIKKGEKIALVGANGAGKTTLVKLICGLYYPINGDVTINGASVKNINIYDYYKLFSVVFQDLHLMPITIAQFVSGNGVDIDRQRVADCLGLAGLYDRVKTCPRGIDTTFHKDLYEDDPGVELSGGEKQKLLLARALYKDAPILILDEPTAALDPIAESEIYQKFNEFAKNKTAVFISHRLASTRFCDRIFLLEEGQITECGNHEQLMAKKGKYYEMFEIQSHYYKENAEEAF
jgi:ABC-type multidrug transport system fused ATPase/permease subunit